MYYFNKYNFNSNLVILVFITVLLSRCSNNTHNYIPMQFWPEFDKKAPYTINGPLWVGYDADAEKWKYLKITFNETANDEQRGLNDPGNPSVWNSDKGQTGYFTCDINDLPSGTHINNRYNPTTMAFKYQVDDIMIKVGNFWIDKYESSIVLISKDTVFIDDPKFGGIDSLNKNKTGTAYDVSPNTIAVSQCRRATSGITYFVAEQTAINNGKHIIRNEQWQAAASGTTRTNAEGMQPNGEDWKNISLIDISRYGVVGCAGSLWEWTSSWGQYGEHYEGTPTNWYDWPGPESHKEWDDKYDTYGNDIIINMAGRAYTRQDSARYASGLPAALVRGGSWGDKNRAGIFALIADGAPSYYGFEVGFRCVK